jgi:hypothetical protein
VNFHRESSGRKEVQRSQKRRVVKLKETQRGEGVQMFKEWWTRPNQWVAADPY